MDGAALVIVLVNFDGQQNQRRHSSDLRAAAAPCVNEDTIETPSNNMLYRLSTGCAEIRT